MPSGCHSARAWLQVYAALRTWTSVYWTRMPRVGQNLLRRLGATTCAIAWLLTSPVTATAQGVEPIGRFVVDVRGSISLYDHNEQLAANEGSLPLPTPVPRTRDRRGRPPGSPSLALDHIRRRDQPAHLCRGTGGWPERPCGRWTDGEDDLFGGFTATIVQLRFEERVELPEWRAWIYPADDFDRIRPGQRVAPAREDGQLWRRGTLVCQTAPGVHVGPPVLRHQSAAINGGRRAKYAADDANGC